MKPGEERLLTPARRLTLALLWLVLLVVAGWVVGQRLQLSGDLRKFMPRPWKARSAAATRAAAAADDLRMAALA